MCDSFLGEGEVGVKSGVQITFVPVARINPSLPLPAFPSRPSRGRDLKNKVLGCGVLYQTTYSNNSAIDCIFY
jgi:hypothetical protein